MFGDYYFKKMGLSLLFENGSLNGSVQSSNTNLWLDCKVTTKALRRAQKKRGRRGRRRCGEGGPAGCVGSEGEAVSAGWRGVR